MVNKDQRRGWIFSLCPFTSVGGRAALGECCVALGECVALRECGRVLAGESLALGECLLPWESMEECVSVRRWGEGNPW